MVLGASNEQCGKAVFQFSIPKGLVGQVPLKTRGRHHGLAIHWYQATMFGDWSRHDNGMLALRMVFINLKFKEITNELP